MADLEKVIKGLESHRERTVCVNEEGEVCPYFSYEDCHRRLTDDALELLKERQWISVKDRLPEFGEAYFAACRSLAEVREPWVIEGNYGLVTHNKPWGVPMISCGEAEVYAWQPKAYPEPPKEGDSE